MPKKTEPYPECEKLADASAARQAVHEFLEWLGTQKVHLMVYKNEAETEFEEDCDGGFDNLGRCREGKVENIVGQVTDKDCVRCKGTGKITRHEPGWYPLSKTRDNIVMDFLGIDQDKLEHERRAMLEALRAS
jgi:hypothetical protein